MTTDENGNKIGPYEASLMRRLARSAARLFRRRHAGAVGGCQPWDNAPVNQSPSYFFDGRWHNYPSTDPRNKNK